MYDSGFIGVSDYIWGLFGVDVFVFGLIEEGGVYIVGVVIYKIFVEGCCSIEMFLFL